MKNKWDVKLEFRKWNIHFHIYRVRGLDNPQMAKIDILFFITFGWGKLIDRLQSGFIFRIALLDFDADENKQLFGFTIPTGKPFIKRKIL